MQKKKAPASTTILATVLGAAALGGAAGCGDLLPWAGGGGGGSVVVRGNLEAFLPDVDTDIVVMVLTTDEVVGDCETPGIAQPDPSERSVVLEPGETDFEVKGVKHGRLVIAFLLDEDGDGSIEMGDTFAVLDDPACELEVVDKKFTVILDDVRVNFSDDDLVDFPDPGRAAADSIIVTDDDE